MYLYMHSKYFERVKDAIYDVSHSHAFAIDARQLSMQTRWLKDRGGKDISSQDKHIPISILESRFFRTLFKDPTRELNHIILAADFRIKLDIGFQLSYHRFHEKSFLYIYFKIFSSKWNTF